MLTFNALLLLLNMKKLLSAIPRNKYENEVRAIRVDVTAGEISVSRVKRVIGDHLKAL